MVTGAGSSSGKAASLALFADGGTLFSPAADSIGWSRPLPKRRQPTTARARPRAIAALFGTRLTGRTATAIAGSASFQTDVTQPG